MKSNLQGYILIEPIINLSSTHYRRYEEEQIGPESKFFPKKGKERVTFQHFLLVFLHMKIPIFTSNCRFHISKKSVELINCAIRDQWISHNRRS